VQENPGDTDFSPPKTPAVEDFDAEDDDDDEDEE
jgi:hypothetical protein